MRPLAFVFVMFSASILACGVDGKNGEPVSSPIFHLKNTQSYAETAAGLPPDVTYGWNLRVGSDVVRWRECASVETCGHTERTRPANELIALERVGEVEIEGEHVEVMKLSLTPRPTYVVPIKPSVPR